MDSKEDMENAAAKEEGAGETDALLGSATNPTPYPKPTIPNGRGGLKKKRQQLQRGSRSRVQWNDRNGNKLAEVLEFQPSDTSDSEDEYADSCICTVM